MTPEEHIDTPADRQDDQQLDNEAMPQKGKTLLVREVLNIAHKASNYIDSNLDRKIEGHLKLCSQEEITFLVDSLKRHLCTGARNLNVISVAHVAKAIGRICEEPQKANLASALYFEMSEEGSDELDLAQRCYINGEMARVHGEATVAKVAEARASQQHKFKCCYFALDELAPALEEEGLRSMALALVNRYRGHPQCDFNYPFAQRILRIAANEPKREESRVQETEECELVNLGLIEVEGKESKEPIPELRAEQRQRIHELLANCSEKELSYIVEKAVFITTEQRRDLNYANLSYVFALAAKQLPQEQLKRIASYLNSQLFTVETRPFFIPIVEAQFGAEPNNKYIERPLMEGLLSKVKKEWAHYSTGLLRSVRSIQSMGPFKKWKNWAKSRQDRAEAMLRILGVCVVNIDDAELRNETALTLARSLDGMDCGKIQRGIQVSLAKLCDAIDPMSKVLTYRSVDQTSTQVEKTPIWHELKKSLSSQIEEIDAQALNEDWKSIEADFLVFLRSQTTEIRIAAFNKLDEALKLLPEEERLERAQQCGLLYESGEALFAYEEAKVGAFTYSLERHSPAEQGKLPKDALYNLLLLCRKQALAARDAEVKTGFAKNVIAINLALPRKSQRGGSHTPSLKKSMKFLTLIATELQHSSAPSEFLSMLEAPFEERQREGRYFVEREGHDIAHVILRLFPYLPQNRTVYALRSLKQAFLNLENLEDGLTASEREAVGTLIAQGEEFITAHENAFKFIDDVTWRAADSEGKSDTRAQLAKACSIEELNVILDWCSEKGTHFELFDDVMSYLFPQDNSQQLWNALELREQEQALAAKMQEASGSDNQQASFLLGRTMIATTLGDEALKEELFPLLCSGIREESDVVAFNSLKAVHAIEALLTNPEKLAITNDLCQLRWRGGKIITGFTRKAKVDPRFVSGVNNYLCDVILRHKTDDLGKAHIRVLAQGLRPALAKTKPKAYAEKVELTADAVFALTDRIEDNPILSAEIRRIVRNEIESAFKGDSLLCDTQIRSALRLVDKMPAYERVPVLNMAFNGLTKIKENLAFKVNEAFSEALQLVPEQDQTAILLRAIERISQTNASDWSVSNCKSLFKYSIKGLSMEQVVGFVKPVVEGMKVDNFGPAYSLAWELLHEYGSLREAFDKELGDKAWILR